MLLYGVSMDSEVGGGGMPSPPVASSMMGGRLMFHLVMGKFMFLGVADICINIDIEIFTSE